MICTSFRVKSILLLEKKYFSDKVLLWVTHQLVTLICVPKVRDSQRSHPSAVLIRVCPRQETRGWWLVKHSGHYHHMTTFLHSVPILSPAPPVTLLFTDWSDHTTEECWIELANEPSRRFQITGKAPTTYQPLPGGPSPGWNCQLALSHFSHY